MWKSLVLLSEDDSLLTVILCIASTLLQLCNASTFNAGGSFTQAILQSVSLFSSTSSSTLVLDYVLIRSQNTISNY